MLGGACQVWGRERRAALLDRREAAALPSVLCPRAPPRFIFGKKKKLLKMNGDSRRSLICVQALSLSVSRAARAARSSFHPTVACRNAQRRHRHSFNGPPSPPLDEVIICIKFFLCIQMCVCVFDISIFQTFFSTETFNI